MKCEFVSEGAGRRLSPHNFTHLVKTGYCLQTRSSVILWIRLICTLWVFCILLFLDWMGWRTEKTFMKFIYRAFCPLIHFLIILALPPSHSLVTDIRAAHSTLVLIKSNRNKPEPITCTARWADLGAEGIHLEGDGTRLFGVTMKSITKNAPEFLWEVFQRQVWWISPMIYLSDLSKKNGKSIRNNCFPLNLLTTLNNKQITIFLIYSIKYTYSLFSAHLDRNK